MAGIYIHIPFCRQACHYCNFHFTTSLRHRNELVAALLKEMELREEYFGKEIVNTIYFGGGTPSILPIEDLKFQIDKINTIYTVAENAEITLEANPDDIDTAKLQGWKEIGINRLSIGVQSFFDEDLVWMNRAHTAGQAINSLELASREFQNISADLIYGTPFLTSEKWKYNVDTLFGFNIPHLSCYALTVEPRTPLQKMISMGKSQDMDPGKQSEQFLLLMQWMADAGYDHYEISNFAKPGFRSRHNSAYWSAANGKQGEKYIGFGPSAHSYDGDSRQWNVSNNAVYIEAIRNGIIPFEKEILTPIQKLNEYIMTSLRTSEGSNIYQLENPARIALMKKAEKYIERGLLKQENNFLVLTRDGRLLADGITADLFFDQ